MQNYTRRPHDLRIGGGIPFPRRMVFFDVETGQQSNAIGEIFLPMAFGRFLFVDLDKNLKITKEYMLKFDELPELYFYLDSWAIEKGSYFLFAHNIQFDLSVSGLLDKLVSGGWALETFFLSRTTSILKLSKGNTKLFLMDTMNFFPGRLKTYEEETGVEKIDIDWDLLYQLDWAVISSRPPRGKFFPGRKEVIKLNNRNRLDVVILKLLMLKWLLFLKKQGLTKTGLSSAGTAFVLYRRNYLDKKIKIHAESEIDDLELASYKGGMCRLFRQGNFSGETFYKLDVNSMYPAVMKKHTFPCRYRGSRTEPSLHQLEMLLDYYDVVADVDIEPVEDRYMRTAGKHTIYPLYRHRGVFCTPELKRMIAHGEIKKIYFLAFYQSTDLFSRYVTDLYAARKKAKKEKDSFWDLAWKLLLNSLYGKFGGQHSEFSRRPDLEGLFFKTDIYIDREAGTQEKVYWIGDKAYTEHREGLAYHSFPAISAHVTSYARMYLWDLISQAGRENVFYCDTDSLIVNKRGYRNLWNRLSTTALGKLKVEAKADTLFLRSRKDYCLGDKAVIKGIPANAKEVSPGIFRAIFFPTLKNSTVLYPETRIQAKERQITISPSLIDGIPGENGFLSPITTPPDFEKDPFLV